jgi:energy-converting hydrogenase Eha subunit G
VFLIMAILTGVRWNLSVVGFDLHFLYAQRW